MFFIFIWNENEKVVEVLSKKILKMGRNPPNPPVDFRTYKDINMIILVFDFCKGLLPEDRTTLGENANIVEHSRGSIAKI